MVDGHSQNARPDLGIALSLAPYFGNGLPPPPNWGTFLSITPFMFMCV
jgi:hypothetical protein